MPLLNLADADTSGFEAMPSATYDAVVYEAKMDEVKNESGEGKLPKGTPMIKVQFKVTEGGEEGEFFNRRQFRNYIIPPAKLGGKKYEHYEMMNGLLVRFLVSLGYEETEVRKPEFDLDLTELVGKECRIVVGQKTYNGEVQNEVKGVKAPGSGASSSGLV